MRRMYDNIDMSKIVDKNGHPRFIEGEGKVPLPSTKVTANYNKWSLNGSHIMFVLDGTLKAGANIDSGRWLAAYTLPRWIANKIVPATNIEVKTIRAYADDGTTIQFDVTDFRVTETSKAISIVAINAIDNPDKDRHFHIQFDLLIDTD